MCVCGIGKRYEFVVCILVILMWSLMIYQLIGATANGNTSSSEEKFKTFQNNNNYLYPSISSQRPWTDIKISVSPRANIFKSYCYYTK